jgi:DNA transformation protein and related proteins
MSDHLTDWLLEVLAPLGVVRVRAMFGGAGVSIDGLSIGLIAEEELFLKVDRQSKVIFEERTLTPFVYFKNGKPYTMSYYQAPPEFYDDVQAALVWARHGFEAAVRAKKPKTPKKAHAAKTQHGL